MIAQRPPHRASDGATNMAVDEALLERAELGEAWIRTYTWDRPTLSLGYFQEWAWIGRESRWQGVPVVRRPTGGGALWHDREITYAVALPKGHPLARHHVALYEAIHDAIASRIRSLGIAADRRGPSADPGRIKPFLCFEDRDPSDVVSGPTKLVGSAQRRRSGAILQHGALLLGRSPITPELSGLIDLNPTAPGYPSEWLEAAILEACGLEPREVGWEAIPADRIERLRERHQDPAWLRKR
ncbi:MAG: biotin/lipoate A/B protein ligase family protein [Isosphaeraceae bacterium]